VIRRINVVDRRGTVLDPTYEKRARQFVRSGRAEWVNDDTIRLSQPQEGTTMEAMYSNDRAPVAEARVRERFEEPSEMDDAVMLERAKHRLAQKKGLISQGLDAVLLLLFTIFTLSLWNYDDQIVSIFVFLSFWGIRYLVRVFRFVKPSMGGGFRRYLRERNKRNLEMEYRRMKRDER